jgi:hypothetical protein
MPLLGTTGTASAKAFNLYGIKSRATIPLTISSNSYNYDVFTNRGPTYVAGASDLVVTVNPGITLGSTSTGTYALLVPNAFSPLDTVTIVNNGVIQGMGGAGGRGSGIFPTTAAIAGSVGGNAIYVNRPTTITNNGTVASGGGGGGGGGNNTNPKTGNGVRGGGGGGGAGFDGGAGGAVGPGPGPGSAGSPGTSPGGGAGGAGGVAPGFTSGTGGAGGGRGAVGTPGGNGGSTSGAGGGAAGNYIVGNPFVTWSVTGTRQGNVA